MGKIFAVLLFILISIPSWATEYYVCKLDTDCNGGDGSGWSTGSDSNNGTSRSTPWATIQKCEDTMVSGDTCIVGDGTYEAASSENATVEFDQQYSSWTTYKAENLHGAKILPPDPPSPYQACLFFNGNTFAYIRIENFELDGNDQSTIVRMYSTASGAEYVYLYRLKIHNLTTGVASMVWGNYVTNVTIDRCLIYDQSSTRSNLDHAIYISGNSATGAGCTDWTIKNSIFYDINGGWPIHIYAGNKSNILIYNNTFLDENADRDGAIVMYNCTDCVVRNNIGYTVNDAVSYDDFLNCNTGNVRIILENNITNLSSAYEADCVGDFDSSTCGTGDPDDCNTVSADLSDEFTNHAGRDYTLRSDALSIDAGTSTGAPDEDHIGTARPQGPLSKDDIGAYEYIFPEEGDVVGLDLR